MYRKGKKLRENKKEGKGGEGMKKGVVMESRCEFYTSKEYRAT